MTIILQPIVYIPHEQITHLPTLLVQFHKGAPWPINPLEKEKEKELGQTKQAEPPLPPLCHKAYTYRHSGAPAYIECVVGCIGQMNLVKSFAWHSYCRLAEVHFDMIIPLQFDDRLQESLKHCRAAQKLMRVVLDEVRVRDELDERCACAFVCVYVCAYVLEIGRAHV